MKEITENQQQEIVVIKAAGNSGFCEGFHEGFGKARHEEGSHRNDDGQKYVDIEKSAENTHDSTQNPVEKTEEAAIVFL